MWRASGDRSLSFFSVKSALTHHCPKGSGGIPPVGRAVRSARRIALSAESARQCRRACGRRSSLPVRLAEGRCPVCRFAANPCPLPGQAATRLRKPATGSFIADMDGTCCPSIFFFGKETKASPCGEQKGRDKLWQFIIWKQRS